MNLLSKLNSSAKTKTIEPRAKFWDEQGMRTATKDNIDGIVKGIFMSGSG